MKQAIGLLFLMVFSACKENKPASSLKEGVWRAELTVMDDAILPFNFNIEKNLDGRYLMHIMNAEERITVDEILLRGDSIRIQTPVFEGYIIGTFTDDNIKGEFIKESLDRVVPFQAFYGEENRFVQTKEATQNVSGIWETEFSPGTEEAYLGKGMFLQDGNQVTGTFRTTTGDYRYLEGIVDADSLRLSAFDGAHAFLFAAKVTDSTMNGTFYSGNHFKEPFVAKLNDGFELPNPDSLTFMKEGYEKLEFTFPDVDGTQVALSDDRFKDKVVVVQLLGTWCPNCLDETKFLTDYLKTHTNGKLEVVGLSFESAKTKEKAIEGIQRLKDRIQVPYPILLAQYGSYDKLEAQQKLPMLNHVLSYPTTIFIDKKGVVRKIHTGFNGPATGEKFTEFKDEFDALITQLSSE